MIMAFTICGISQIKKKIYALFWVFDTMYLRPEDGEYDRNM